MATSFVAGANPLADSKKKTAIGSAQSSGGEAKLSWTQKATKGEELYVHMKTSMGNIVLRLFSKDAPKTVENFVGLASGEKEWTNPATGKDENKPLYTGTVFHRVIPGFMIQGGDPLGQGTGGPGYRFEDEFQSGRKFDKPGLLAMANAGPNTNGSQFFITVVPTPHLNNRHTIFGEVVKGMDVVQKIVNAPRNKMDRPNEEIRIIEIKLSQTPNPPAK
ncbi:MAG: peptidylprolyl isomerase [Cystobacterineae bacterium]|nr:peptidylprolyl isomerase [Cystobacterineae bacterium]